jgi:hypothetical protein
MAVKEKKSQMDKVKKTKEPFLEQPLLTEVRELIISAR